ncbi:MAG: TolC family protein [Sphingobacteriales bacterium]|nr:MAG: TolC family protein [Sphingobacteriales bacterium]
MFNKALVRGIILCCCLCNVKLASAEANINAAQADTLQLNLKQVEKIFLDKNLQLLAQHYDIEASKALIQQAKLWDNPVLNTDQNVYSNKRYFEHGIDANGQPIGQYYVQLEQLIKTAGKRGKEIKLAQTNAQISQLQFNDLLRNLRLELRSTFYQIVQLQNIQQLYIDQKVQLEKLRAGMDGQYKAGNVAMKDLLRVQALAISTQQEAVENDKALNDAEAQLKVLLQMGGSTYIKPIVAATDYSINIPAKNENELVDLAKQNNDAYQLQQMQLIYQQQNLSLQKAMAVPDFTVGPNFDKNSNYTANYVGMGISFPLPLLNRNQGNIKVARMQVKQGEANLSQAEVQLQNDLSSAYKKLQYTLQLSATDQDDFYTDYNKLYESVLQSYKQRQLSLIEFIDYFDAYKDIKQKQLQQQLNIQLAKEELNYITGTDVFNQ